MKNASTSLILTRNHLKFLLWGDIAAIAILLILSIAVMMSSSVENCLIIITGTENKLELLKFIGWVISGFIAVFGVIGLFQRAEALDKQNEVNEQGHIQRAATIEKGHVQERFKAATEHLGNKDSVSARIAAFYEFYRLAKIESEPDLKENIFDILCAHLRQTTKHKDYKPEERGSKKEIKSTEEVQSLLNILFNTHNKDKFIFVGMVADLEGANLQGANLQEANLQGANLQEANLQDTIMLGSKMAKANLWDACLQKADLSLADFYKADLRYTELQEAYLIETNLQGAKLQNANLQGASLQDAKINKKTKMPDGWKNVVKKDNDGKTGVLVVDEQGKIIERL